MFYPSAAPYPLSLVLQRLLGEGYANMMAGRALLYQTAACMDLDADPKAG